MRRQIWHFSLSIQSFYIQDLHFIYLYGVTFFKTWFNVGPLPKTGHQQLKTLPCKAKRQYLLTLQLSRFFLALQSRTHVKVSYFLGNTALQRTSCFYMPFQSTTLSHECWYGYGGGDSHNTDLLRRMFILDECRGRQSHSQQTWVA